MCMDFNGHPCSFFACTFVPCSKSCDDKSCYEAASVFFLLNMVPRYRIADTIQCVTFMYILMSILQFRSFHKV